MNRDALNAAIDEAVTYCFPLYEVARTRYCDALGDKGQAALPSNQVLHDPRVCDHRSRWVTMPNNDTLYSRAWLDLTTGPVRIEIDTLLPERYWSVAFIDAWTNNFAIMGSRTAGNGPVSVTLVGPGGESGLSTDSKSGRVIQAPGHDVWLFARWLVDPEGDQSIGQDMQSRLHLSASGAGRSLRAMPTGAPDAASFVAIVSERLAFNPPPAGEIAMLGHIAALGLRPSLDDPWPKLSDELRQAWVDRLPVALDSIRDKLMRNRMAVQGWTVRLANPGNFGDNYVDRATVALAGLGALPAEEAVYALRTHDDEVGLLNGQHRYCLTVPATGIAADSFWSISMYEATADGRRFFVDNPIGRYTIGDRTPGLRYEADGSLRIWIQTTAPDDPLHRANWLPAAKGAFFLGLRAYLPRPEMREWKAPLPGVSRLDH